MQRKWPVAVLLLAVWGMARASAQEGPTKIAFVDVQRALLSIEEGKAKRKELQDWAAPRQQELQRLDQEIQTLQQELGAKQQTATLDQLSELNRRLTAKKREFEDKQRQYSRELEEKQNEVLRALGQKLEQLLAEYASSEKYTAVFILQPEQVAFVATSADITDKLIQLYNQKYPYPPKGGSK
ncbi:MAG: OmpH family outer membrane protein [Thermoanaerobaculum sp.]|nr:OmpH family outer membrane protein [Thermoanaerobaculum sp.]MCX7896068.1 OmpH family outer membrane protein [Thermoanaerobaculum sp.]MDW7967988.1 OmpH family outer membrane protein [Thermoanaerobaculum sp.]